jgi:hypothetical protein
LPPSTQAPLGQVVMPLWHGLEKVHDAPGVQLAPQVPLWQLMPVPQAVPSD